MNNWPISLLRVIAVGTVLCGAGSGAVIGGSIGVTAGAALAKQVNEHPVCIATPASNNN